MEVNRNSFGETVGETNNGLLSVRLWEKLPSDPSDPSELIKVIDVNKIMSEVHKLIQSNWDADCFTELPGTSIDMLEILRRAGITDVATGDLFAPDDVITVEEVENDEGAMVHNVVVRRKCQLQFEDRKDFLTRRSLLECIGRIYAILAASKNLRF